MYIHVDWSFQWGIVIMKLYTFFFYIGMLLLHWCTCNCIIILQIFLLFFCMLHYAGNIIFTCNICVTAEWADHQHRGDRAPTLLPAQAAAAGGVGAVRWADGDGQVSHHQRLPARPGQGRLHPKQHQLLSPDLGQSDPGYHTLKVGQVGILMIQWDNVWNRSCQLLD